MVVRRAQAASTQAPGSAEETDSLEGHDPLNFGKRLAHSDKLVRGRGFETLRRWLAQPHLDRVHCKRLWKSLYLGVWMADKRTVQQELSVQIAVLVNLLARKMQAVWMECFWETMEAEWARLDINRVNKFLPFLRTVISEFFKSIRLGGWHIDEARACGRVFTQCVPPPDDSQVSPSQALLLHVVRIFWSELCPQLESSSSRVSQELLLQIVEPFCALAETCHIDALVRSIHQHILCSAPLEFAATLAKRVLEGTRRAGISLTNREKLHQTARDLETLARRAPEVPTLLREASADEKGEIAAAARDVALQEERRNTEVEVSLTPLSTFRLPPAQRSPALAVLPDKVSSKTCQSLSPLLLPKSAPSLKKVKKKKLKTKRVVDTPNADYAALDGVVKAVAAEAKPTEKRKKKLKKKLTVQPPPSVACPPSAEPEAVADEAKPTEKRKKKLKKKLTVQPPPSLTCPPSAETETVSPPSSPLQQAAADEALLEGSPLVAAAQAAGEKALRVAHSSAREAPPSQLRLNGATTPSTPIGHPDDKRRQQKHKRRVSFDLKANKVLKYRQKDRVVPVAKLPAKRKVGSAHKRQGALRSRVACKG